jgi:hypothetical protein
VDRVITVFISSRNSFHTGLVNIDLCWDQVAYLECDVKETDFLSLSQSVRRQRTKRLMPLTVGKIIFLRMQTWLVVLVYVFKPKLGRAIYLGPQMQAGGLSQSRAAWLLRRPAGAG